jgi:hypothetical protein
LGRGWLPVGSTVTGKWQSFGKALEGADMVYGTPAKPLKTLNAIFGGLQQFLADFRHFR